MAVSMAVFMDQKTTMVGAASIAVLLRPLCTVGWREPTNARVAGPTLLEGAKADAPDAESAKVAIATELSKLGILVVLWTNEGSNYYCFMKRTY